MTPLTTISKIIQSTKTVPNLWKGHKGRRNHCQAYNGCKDWKMFKAQSKCLTDTCGHINGHCSQLSHHWPFKVITAWWRGISDNSVIMDSKSHWHQWGRKWLPVLLNHSHTLKWIETGDVPVQYRRSFIHSSLQYMEFWKNWFGCRLG